MRINNDWKFTKLQDVEIISEVKDLHELHLDDRTWEKVQIPHTWYQDGAAYEGVTVYQREIKQAVQEEEALLLQFEAADRWAAVYVNGMYVGEHKGGYSAFAFDITPFCKGGTQTVTVLLDNRSWNEISPLAGDFTVFGGIYRNVNLLVQKKDYFDRTYYGTDGVIACTDVDTDGNGKINIQSYIKLTQEHAVVVYTCLDADGKAVAEEKSKAGSQMDCEIRVNQPHYWDGQESPYQYTLRAELLVADVVVDTVEKRIGFKKVVVDADKGFFLNGKHKKLNGVAKHQDRAEVFHCVTDAQLEEDLEEILEIGANSVRLSHYQHPQKMYDLCDEHGLVVWAEVPFLKLEKSDAFYENIKNQLKELILQNMHHPSIAFWGVQNEIAMFAEDETTYAYVKGLDKLARELDKTRISATANLFSVQNDSPLNKINQAVGYNIYFGWYYGEMKDNDDFVAKFHADNPQVPLAITEYGVDCNLAFHGDTPKVRDYTEEYQALYHETVYPCFAGKDYVWGTYVWNMFDFSSGVRDEGGVKYKNCKGLVTYDRKTKKDAFYYYKAQWAEEPFVRITGSRYVNRVTGNTAIKVYSNQSEVVLNVGEHTYTRQSDNGVFLFEQVPLLSGENIIRAVAGDSSDTVTLYGVQEADASYVYVDKNPGLNVRNWFLDALEEEKLFPKGKYSIRDATGKLVQNEEVMAVIADFNENLAKKLRERNGMMPLERVLSYMKNEISEDECKELNARLTKIAKEES